MEDDTVISGTNEKKFLSHIETKALTRYLSLSGIEYFKNRNIKYRVQKLSIGYVVVYNSKSFLILMIILPIFDHEELDTLILLQALNASSRNPSDERKFVNIGECF